MPAVDQQQLRRVGEPAPALLDRLVPLGQVGAQPAGEDLAHGREVVVLVDGADLEPAVLLRPGQAVLHDHHAADVVGALQVAHVVALDAQRRLGQVEGVLQGVEGPGPGVVVGGPLQAVPGELLPGVPGDHLEQGLLLAPLGHPDLHPERRTGPSG